MLRHIVFWKFNGNVTNEKKRHQIKALLEALRDKIPEIVDLEVGLDITQDASSADLVLNTLFHDQEALQRYQKHAEHVAVVNVLREHTFDKRVVDYEVSDRS